MAQSREKIEQDLLDYIEGRLPPDERARIEIFLANTDPKLARQVAGMMEDREMLQSSPPVSPPADMADLIMARVERQSLIGGVEKQLVIEPRRWFQTRMAIAAGFAIVIGGLSFWVVKNVWYPSNSMQPWATNIPKNEVNEHDAPVSVIAPVGPGPMMTKGGGPELARVEDPKKDVAVPNAAPTTLAAAFDADAQIAQRVKQGRLLALGSLDAGTAGYRAASTTQDALSQVNASNHSAADSSPIVITLVSRDAGDVQRLESLLTAYADQAEARKAEGVVGQQSKATQMAQVPDQTGAGGTGRGGGRAMRPAAVSPGSVGQGSVAPGGAAAAAANSPEKHQDEGQLDTRVHNMATPDTYHVLLRADQLDQISKDFSISSVARGAAAYAVAQGENASGKTRDDAVASNSISPRAMSLSGGAQGQQQAGQFNGSTNGQSANMNQSQMNANGLNGGGNSGGGVLTNSGNTYDNNNDKAAAGAGGQGGGANSFSGPTNIAGGDLTKETGTRPNEEQKAELPWIDCVITIVPTTATAPAQK